MRTSTYATNLRANSQARVELVKCLVSCKVNESAGTLHLDTSAQVLIVIVLSKRILSWIGSMVIDWHTI